VDLDSFWARLQSSPNALLLLDYDGTLAPFTVDRLKATPYRWLPPMLDKIIELGKTRVVIITGRKLQETKRLLGLRHSVEIWGSHGLERLLPSGELKPHQESKEVIHALDQIEEWADNNGISSLLERKPGCMALHLRGLPPERQQEIQEKGAVFFHSIEEQVPQMVARPFDGGIELREKGCNKGDAVATILEEYQEIPPTAFLGDDLTDEDGFLSIKERGLGILVREEFRKSAADIWLKPPAELRWFLERWIECQRSRD